MEVAELSVDADVRDALRYQQAVLPAVSRTFALTIPRLPAGLRETVTNAYLLCRIADTIEDEPDLAPEEIRRLHAELLAVLNGRADAQAFARDAARALGDGTVVEERELTANTHQVVAVFAQLPSSHRDAIVRCIERMCTEMSDFHASGAHVRLTHMRELNRYCYVVAGVVGEMLTDLFSEHSSAIAAQRDKMMTLAASFGQGLQMTNILKDVWDDLRRDTCWLPSEVLDARGYPMSKLDPDYDRTRLAGAIEDLVSIAHGHLRNALDYTLFIPKRETGIRTFCIWSIQLAVLTLQKIRKNPEYASGADVKVSKTGLFTTLGTTLVTIRSNLATRVLFECTAARLPLAPVGNGYQSDYAVNDSSAADPASDAHNGTVLARVAQGD